jgi:glutaconyl-CoA decarboxylase
MLEPVNPPRCIADRHTSADSEWLLVSPAPAPAAKPVAAGAATVTAPMPGKVLEVKCKAGDAVKSGQVLLILEAMKMQNEIMAPADGTIADVRVSAGSTVNTGDVMIVM